MRVSTVARVVRMSVIAAAVVAPSLAAARTNDPLAPKADAGRVSASAMGGSQPWFKQTASGGSQPWFKQTASGGSQPWFKQTASGGSQPWF